MACYGLNVSPPTNSYVEILTFKDEAPFRWGLQEMLKSLANGISAL